jgi:hypothetical protein
MEYEIICPVSVFFCLRFAIINTIHILLAVPFTVENVQGLKQMVHGTSTSTNTSIKTHNYSKSRNNNII